MTLLTIETLTKSYGEKILFNNISFVINEEDKIGLIGINGTGKSTLLKIIAGQESKDSGQISQAKGLTIAYLSQNPDCNENATVYEQIFRGSSKSMDLIRTYEKALTDMEDDPNNTSLQEVLLKLTTQMKDQNLWDMESQVKIILTKLGITDIDATMNTLSGGQKKRVALACALLTPCDLLILDEPTNHMDNSTIDWMEKYLANRKGALLMVTHDRYFLDRVVNKTIELDNGNLYTYSGNYSQFIEKKLERQNLATALERKRQNLYRRELDWIRRGARARTTKQKARIDRFNEIENTTYLTDDSNISIDVAYSRLGQKIIELNHVSKSFFNNSLIKDFNYIVLRDDRIGIIGDNGIGKSTLLNIICRKLYPDEGDVEIGTTVKIGYFSQESEDLNQRLRAIDYIKEAAEYITTADGLKISASTLMENFLFTGDMQWTPISRLSGGEKRRLYLLRILMSEPNVLILDEPTNDLDIDTLKILENYLDDFNGAVITVSHDRYFLDRVCNKIFSFEGNTKITQHTGNYSDYLEHLSLSDLDNIPSMKPNVKTENQRKDEVKALSPDNRNIRPRFTYQEKLEFEKIDELVQVLEVELDRIEEELQKSATDFVKLQELMDRKDTIEEELLVKMERQEYLYNLDASIKAYKNE